MTRLNDERIAEIEALWANDRQTVMDHIPDLLAEVKELRVEKAQAEAERDNLLGMLVKQADCPSVYRDGTIFSWCRVQVDSTGKYKRCRVARKKCWLKYAQQQVKKEGE